MSGHSKWATIKHKKGALDAKRGALFTKIIKEITTAARNGGGSPDSHPRLGTGELPGVSYEEHSYEGYGPGGIAILIEALTDNKNRTTAEIRSILEKKGGNMSGAGSVAWQFAKKGFIVVKKEAADEDKLMTIALDAGASDFNVQSDSYEITSELHEFEAVKKAIADARIATESAEITQIPSATVKVPGLAEAKSLMALVDALEEHEDVQNVYANFDIPDEIFQELAK